MIGSTHRRRPAPSPTLFGAALVLALALAAGPAELHDSLQARAKP